MIRFNNTNKPKNKKLLIFISDFIRKIFGGDKDDYKANLRNDVPHLLKSVCSFYSNLL